MAYLPLTPPDYVGTPARGERIAGPYRPMNRATRTAWQSLMNRPRTVPGVVLCRIRAVDLWRSPRRLCHSEPRLLGAKNLAFAQGKLRAAIPQNNDEIAQPVPKRKRGISLLAKTGWGCASR